MLTYNNNINLQQNEGKTTKATDNNNNNGGVMLVEQVYVTTSRCAIISSIHNHINIIQKKQ